MSYAKREGSWFSCKQVNCIMCRHNTILSRMKNTSLSVFSSTEMQSDEKARGLTFVYPNGHRTHKSSLSAKEASKWHFPPWLYLATFILSGLIKSQPGAFHHLSVVHSVHPRQNQPSPTLTPPSLKFCPKSHWLEAQTN